jgi:hypothetical protein
MDCNTWNRNRASDSYTAIKKMACNNSKWKAANQSKDWRIRRKEKVCREITSSY